MVAFSICARFWAGSADRRCVHGRLYPGAMELFEVSDFALSGQLVFRRRPIFSIHQRQPRYGLAKSVLGLGREPIHPQGRFDRNVVGHTLLTNRSRLRQLDVKGQALMRKWLAFALLLLAPCVARAHIGSPNVIYEGLAAPYPLRVLIRPPGV